MPFYVRQFNDQDYLDEDFIKEHPEAADWYNEFALEYYSNSFEPENGLHDNAGFDRKELYTATNARSRDVYNKFRRRVLNTKEDDIVTNTLDTDNPSDHKLSKEQRAYESPEDALIEFIDRRRDEEGEVYDA